MNSRPAIVMETDDSQDSIAELIDKQSDR